MRLISLFLAYLLSTGVYSSTLLTEISGKKTEFTSLHGKWVMINYWASWCQPCLDEIQELNAFYQHNHDKVALYAVNYDGVPRQRQEKLIQKYHITYPSLRDDPAQILELGDLVGVPATFVFNPEGQLVDTLYGGQTIASLNKVITEDRF